MQSFPSHEPGGSRYPGIRIRVLSNVGAHVTFFIQVLAATALLWPFAAAADRVEYELVFEGLWSPEHATEPFPGSAHFTSLVGATHSEGEAL